ncbi:MAG: DNA-processing protein DprA [Clostridia bacterium]|nr:DNA-processing protein DprA [Clostridia bacterium]
MKASPVEYWIWLQTALGAGARTDELLGYFESPEQLYLAGSVEWKLSGLLTEKKIHALKSSTPSQTTAVLRECRAKGYEIITPDSVLYPDRLRNISCMPLVLYGMGDCSVLNDPVSIGIVGTRNASEYGIQIAQKLSYRLAQSGATVISGGALGIDSEAHAGAMLAKGRTLAFLGCGLSYNYLPENAPIRRAITRYGAVVSEYQPIQAPSKATFPIRNRLISGTSLGVVVIEAGVKSGSLITADRAAEQGRDVFAVPGDIVRSSFDGTNHLIQNGAKPVFSAMDVLCEYEFLYPDLIDYEKAVLPLSSVEYVNYRKPSGNKKTAEEKMRSMGQTSTVVQEKVPVKKADLTGSASDDAISVYGVLTEEPMHIDDIARATELKMNIVLSSLTELEILGVCELMGGKKYKII